MDDAPPTTPSPIAADRYRQPYDEHVPTYELNNEARKVYFERLEPLLHDDYFLALVVDVICSKMHTDGKGNLVGLGDLISDDGVHTSAQAIDEALKIVGEGDPAEVLQRRRRRKTFAPVKFDGPGMGSLVKRMVETAKQDGLAAGNDPERFENDVWAASMDTLFSSHGKTMEESLASLQELRPTQELAKMYGVYLRGSLDGAWEHPQETRWQDRGESRLTGFGDAAEFGALAYLEEAILHIANVAAVRELDPSVEIKDVMTHLVAPAKPKLSAGLPDVAAASAGVDTPSASR